MTLNDAATAGGENVCLSCLDNAGISHNGAYKVLSVMGRDGEFHEQLEPCRCECHSALASQPTKTLAAALRRWFNSHADDGEAEEALARAAQDWLDG